MTDVLHFFKRRGHDKSASVTLGDDITAVDQSFDASNIINKLTVVGMGPGSTHLAVTVEDAESQEKYGVMEGQFSEKDIHDIDTLTSFANAILKQTVEAKHRMLIELSGSAHPEFELGDTVHVEYPDAGIDGNYRIISADANSGVGGDQTKLEVASPQFRMMGTFMEAERRLDAEDYHPQGAPSIITLEKSENVDSTHPLTMEFYVPEEAVDMGKLQIREARIALTLEPFRAHSTGAASGGGHTSGASSASTTAGGGGQTSHEGLPHTHTISAQTAQSRDLGTKTAQSKDLGTKTSYSAGPGYYTGYGRYSLSAFSWSGTVYFTHSSGSGTPYQGEGSEYWASAHEVMHDHEMASHYHNVPIGSHDHSVPIGSHDHSVTAATAANESTHTHTVDDHTHGMQHTHQVYNHTHNIVYGIYTSTYPASVYIKLNGTQIAGPFNSKSYVDITTEFLDKITTYGWNTLEFTTAQLGKIGVTLFMSLFLQAS